MAFEITSPEFTVNVVCLPANVVMSSSISVSSFQFVHLDTVSNRLVFGPFTCSVPACCLNIQYSFRVAHLNTADIDPNQASP